LNSSHFRQAIERRNEREFAWAAHGGDGRRRRTHIRRRPNHEMKRTTATAADLAIGDALVRNDIKLAS
jgi:hypothetical protein